MNGVILSVKQQTLQTSSVIADALLGTGEALDCFNQKSQDADTMGSYISNLAAMQSVQNSINEELIVTQQLKVIDSIPAPNDKATFYKKVFGDCCDVPQSCGCCGDCNCKDTE